MIEIPSVGSFWQSKFDPGITIQVTHYSVGKDGRNIVVNFNGTFGNGKPIVNPYISADGFTRQFRPAIMYGGLPSSHRPWLDN